MNKKLKIGVTIIAILASIFIGTKVYATTGKTINDNTRLRKEASTNSDVVELISKNETVEIESEDGDWYKVSYKSSDGNTYKGYVRNDLLEVEEVPAQEETKQEENAENQENVEEKITEKSEVELNNDVELKVLPLVYSSKKGSVSKNTKVTVTEVIGNWCFVETEDQEGWVMASKLQVKQDAAQENKEVKEEEKQEEKEEVVKIAKGTKLYVSTSTLNLREKTDTSSKILEQLEQNDEVTVVETVDSTWTKVTFRGVTGYVATKYLTNVKPKEVSSRSSEDRTEKNNTSTEKEDTTKKETSATQNSSNTEKKTTTTSKDTKSTETSKKSEEKTESKQSSSKTSSSSKVTGADVIAYAKKFLGCKYVYGATGPNTFDCSGFTQYVYKHFGYKISRTSKTQRSDGKVIKNKSDLQLGDIVCFEGHVGLYVGDGKFIHASHTGSDVKISSLNSSYYKNKFIQGTRILK